MLAAVVAVAVACGGGSSGTPETINRTPTDPGSVPSSTPISGDQVYLIRDNGISAPTGASVTPAPGGTETPSGYEVKSGDTCGSIAASLGVETDALIAANPAINAGCTNLRPGQLLVVPGGSSGGGSSGNSSPPTPTPGAGETYTIESGDTCYDIAASYGVDLDAFVALNDLDCGNLKVGTVVRIP